MISICKGNPAAARPASPAGKSRQPVGETGSLLDMCNHQQRRYLNNF